MINIIPVRNIKYASIFPSERVEELIDQEFLKLNKLAEKRKKEFLGMGGVDFLTASRKHDKIEMARWTVVRNIGLSKAFIIKGRIHKTKGNAEIELKLTYPNDLNLLMILIPILLCGLSAMLTFSSGFDTFWYYLPFIAGIVVYISFHLVFMMNSNNLFWRINKIIKSANNTYST